MTSTADATSVDQLIGMDLCQAHHPPQRHAEQDRDNCPDSIGERHWYDLAMREQLAGGPHPEREVGRALIGQEEGVAGDNGNKPTITGWTPDTLATGARAMVTSGAAACQRIMKLIAKQSTARPITKITGTPKKSPAAALTRSAIQ